MWLLLSFFLEGCLCCRWCCYRVSLDRTRVSFYLNWEWGRHWSCILLFLFTQKELTQFPSWWRRMQARCIWNVHLAISVCWTVWYSDQNHNSNSNKTFLMPAKFRLHIFYCNVTMYQYVEKSVGLTLLLMVQFCEILSNEPSTYINWFDSIRGWCLKIEKSVCLFIHSINMISVDRGLTPCRMFFHNHHQEKNTSGSNQLNKNTCNSTSKWRIQNDFFHSCVECASHFYCIVCVCRLTQCSS